MMLVDNIDIKFIHKFNLLSKICTKMIFPCHRIYPGFGDSSVVRSTSFPEYPLRIIWKSFTRYLEKMFNGVLYIISLWTSTWTPKWNFMQNGAFIWNFTKMGFWAIQIIKNKDGMQYFSSMMLVENIDIKSIHKINKTLAKNIPKLNFNETGYTLVLVT